MFAMFDLGNLVGQPAVGMMLEAARWANVPAYPAMFAAMATTLLTVAGTYAVVTRNERFAEERTPATEITPRPGESKRDAGKSKVASETSGPAL